VTSDRSYRRTHYFIDRPMQTKFFAKLFILLLIEAVLIGTLLYMAARGTLTTSYVGTELRIERTSQFFSLNFVLILLIAAVGVGLAGAIVFILHSHRIAGPAYRLRRSLEDLTAGNLTLRVHLREKDELKELAEALNRLAERLDRSAASVKHDLGALEAALQAGDVARAKDALARLRQEIDPLRTSS